MVPRRPRREVRLRTEVKFSVICKSCKWVASKLSQVQIHAKCHIDLACYLCVCSASDTLLTFTQLIDHCQVEHKELVFLCPLCHTLFQSANTLVSHERTHTGEKPYACPLCEYKSAQSSSLEQHIRTHTGDKPYVCPLCDYSSAQSGKLYRHMRRHPGFESIGGPQAVTQHSCPECHKVFTQKAHLQRHMVVHTGERPYKCTFCPYDSTDPSGLRRHSLRHGAIVTPARLLTCPEIGCGFRADRPSRLQRHARVHSGEKPFNCEFCDRFFSEKATVAKHVRAIHYPGSKELACPRCNYTTKRHGWLQAHFNRYHAPYPDFFF